MIGGIGTDLVDLMRVENCYERFGKRFVSRILSDREQQIFTQYKSHRRQIEWLAGRFAAKEAIAKAWGTGIGEALSFVSIEILPDHHGKPLVYLPNGIVHHAGSSSFQMHLSITHTETQAMAFAVLELRSEEVGGRNS